MTIGRRALIGGSAALAATPGGALASTPPAERPALAALVGEFGLGEALHTVGEADGRLRLAEPGRPSVLLAAEREGWRTPDGRWVRFRKGLLQLGEARLPRRDVGAEVEAAIRAGVRADFDRLRREALAARPPVEPRAARVTELVRLADVAPGVRFDIRYAGADNFMGTPIYERAGAWMQRPAALALARAQASLAGEGLGLLVYDAYRPWFATKMFWDATPVSARAFVANPADGSRHNRGCAVDLTLCDLRSGAPVEMTGRYDEFSRRSHPDYAGGTTRQRWFRDRLRRAIEAQGYTVFAEEWWHFDYRDWRAYGIGARTFTELEAAR